MSIPYHYVAAASSNQDSQVASGSPGTLTGIFLCSVAATARYVKLYNKATAPASTDTPMLTLLIPGGTAGSGSNVPLPVPVSFLSGLGIRITTGMADSDTGAATAGDVVVNLLYS